MDELTKTAWKECLMLWKKLSETPDTDVPKGDVTYTATLFKNKVLKKLGIRKRKFGCPFCESFFNTRKCPLGNCKGWSRSCLSTSYHWWERKVEVERKHKQDLAKDFYDYLQKKYDEEISKEKK